MAPTFLLWILATSGALAQTLPWRPTSPTDTAAVRDLISQGHGFKYAEPAKAIVFYQKAHALAERRGYRKGYFASMYPLAFSLNLLGRHQEARKLAEEALRLARQDSSQIKNLASTYVVLAITAWRQGEWAEAIRDYQLAAPYMRRLKADQNLATIHNNIGIIYREQKYFQPALREFKAALDLARQAGKRRTIVETAFNLGSTYAIMENWAEATHYLREAEQSLDSVKDRDVRLYLLTNFGQMARVQASKEHNPARQRALLDSALACHRQALQMSRQVQNPVEELRQLNDLAGVYNDQKLYVQAQPLVQQALSLMQRNGNAPTDQRDIYRELVRINRGLGNYQAAYKWREQYAKVDSALNSAETKKQLEGYEVKIRQAEAREKLAAQQKQISRLESAQQRQRERAQLAGASGAGAAAFLLLGLLYYRQRQRTHATALLALQREQDLLAVQAEVQGQQKERVRIAKEMHDDMGASLTVIGLLSEVMKTRPETAAAPEVEKISTLSADLISTMNQIIWSLNPSNDSLNGLIAYVRAYAREFLENTPLRLRIEAEEAPGDVRIAGDDRRNVFLAVKEALHNVVKHAEATRVTLRVKTRDGGLHVEICDDGRGFGPDGPMPRPGRNGLTNMAQRLREAGGSCRVHAAVGGGTCVELRYPYAGAEVAARA